jgi:hypothetical protein
MGGASHRRHGGGRRHVQRIQQAVFEHILEAIAVQRRHHLAGDHEHQIAIVIPGPEAILDRHMGDGGHDLGAGAVGVRPEQQIPGPQAKAGPVRDQIAHGDPLGDEGVRQAKLGQIGAHRRVPLQPVFVDQHGQQRHRHGLGVGGDGELGDLAGRFVGALAFDAIAARHDGAAAPNDGDPDRRLVRPGGHDLADMGVDGLGDGGVLILGRCVSGPAQPAGGGPGEQSAATGQTGMKSGHGDLFNRRRNRAAR